VPETYRSLTEAGRTFFGGDQPTGGWQRRANEARDMEGWYKNKLSPVEHQAEERKFFPGVDDLSAWSDFPAVAAHHIAGVVPFLLSGAAAKALKAPEYAAKAFNVLGMGAQQFGSYNN